MRRRSRKKAGPPARTTRKRRRPESSLTPPQLRKWRQAQRDPDTKAGATQKQAAEWYGCSLRGWQYWETGMRSIPYPLLRRISLGHTIFPQETDP